MTDFAITANDARIQYPSATGGQTVFPYDFPIYAEAHIVVLRVRAGVTTTLTLTTDYTLSGVGSQAGGNVTLTSGATAGDAYTLYRDVPSTRATDYNEAGDFFATTINQDLDLAVMRDQQFDRDLTRVLRLAPEDTLATLNEIPSVTARAGMFMTFDGSGQPSVASGLASTPVSASMAPVVAATSLAAARTAMGLGSMATQDSAAVSISGGTASLSSLGASAIAGSAIVAGNMMSTPLLGASTIDATSIALTGSLSTPALGASAIAANTINLISVTTTGSIYLNDTSNASNTTGLTINQGAQTNEILSLKSSNVAHGITGVSETDTYLSFAKINVTGGGAYMTPLTGASTVQALYVDVIAGTGNTTHNAGGLATVMFSVRKKSGTSATQMDANVNLFGIANGAGLNFIVDVEGDVFYDGTAAVFDAWDDAALLRAHQLYMRDKVPHLLSDKILPSRYDDNRYTRDHLLQAGIINVLADDALTNQSLLAKVTHGAIWQQHEMFDALVEAVEAEIPGFTANRLRPLFKARGLPTQVLDWPDPVPDGIAVPAVAPDPFNKGE